MKQRVVWQLGLAVVFLTGVGTSRAGVQGHVTVCWLGTKDWQLREKKGKVYLVEYDWQGVAARIENKPSDAFKSYQWHVSAPTIHSQSGKFLGNDPEGRTPSVCLVKDKGANTRWAFVIVDYISPGHGRSIGERELKVGPSGFQFRAKMTDGPFKNWYLAAEEPNERKGDGPGTRRLKLVRDVKEATVFSYIDANYYVDHK
jgi:hypothetical protein